MTRALTPTPRRASTLSSRESAAPHIPQMASTALATAAPSSASTMSAISSPTILAHDAALVASRLRIHAGRLALLTLRILPEGRPRQSGASLTVGEPTSMLMPLPSRTKRRRAKPTASPSTPSAAPTALTALTALDTRDVLATLNTIVPRLRTLIRRTDELLIAHDGAAVLLRDPAPEGARIVAQRLRNALTDLTDHASNASALAADTNVRQDTQRVQLLLGIDFVTFDATGAIANTDSPCNEDDENADDHCDERHYPNAAPIVSIAHVSSAGAASDDTFDARFARLFAHAWESTAQAPGAIALIDASHMDADPPTPGGATSSATTETAKAQQELALRRQATMLGVPFARLPTLLPGACRRAISRTLASELRAVPIGYAHATLTVAMERPCDAQAVRRLRQATGHTIFPVLGASDEIARAITQLKP